MSSVADVPTAKAPAALTPGGGEPLLYAFFDHVTPDWLQVVTIV